MIKKKYILILIFFFNLLLINITFGNEKDYFLTLKYDKVNVRNGPSDKHQIKFIYKKKFFPIKIIDKHENFRKIIDFYNNSGWIHITQLSKKKSAINILDLSFVFNKPNIYSRPLAKLEKGKMLIIKKCNADWCKIELNNGSGWIQKKFLWGKF